MKNLLKHFWDCVGEQNASALTTCFQPNAIIKWHNTNEQFVVNEFVKATCDYPDDWSTKIERIEGFGNYAITVVRVCNLSANHSFYATSFFEFQDNKILLLDEYWGDNGSAPQWRLDMKIGKPIHSIE